ncbi:prolyl oligopeptidase family serine peptidase [Shewanella inventionis]|uniref:Peptidase S9 n=1 Tax=Shewanella inventionis TaxID=1738770 RepID=A0ABQ1IPV2_9GAMM|nr:prolyl oligopeptidase family serine peptidase [Shewanella inventionis]MCL1159461.1 prolyl oligopeptidase family serine peptidase [Shewanella inventionis]UAL44353.1 prolyl oligopeptidase family serine peptidase [Shewanella inventionis]GGB47170.1 peptidase S9 [Shewanella inventionis]
MNSFLRHFTISAVSLAMLGGCATTTNSTSPVTPSISSSATSISSPANISVPLVTPPRAEKPLTLNQIMANPDWMGILAQGAYWSDDSQSVYFSRQAHQSPVRDYYQQSLSAGEANQLDLSLLHLADQQHGVINQAKSKKAFIYQGNVFIKDLQTGDVAQITRQNMAIDGIRFLNNGDLAYWQGNNIFRLHQATGMTEQIAAIEMSNEPKGVQEPSSYIAKQQHRLIDYVALQHTNDKKREQYRGLLEKADPTLSAKPWYLGDSEVISEMSLSPDGRYVMLALTDKNYSWRAEHDIMPNYLGKDGYVDAVPARARVAEDAFPGQRLVLLDLVERTKKDITIEGLTGFDEDVLASVKAENAKAQGKTYKSENAPRLIQLMQDWEWSQSAMQWRDTDNQLLVMLEAVDNKDRWIARVDLQKGKLITEHRLHDDAWVNYNYNQFGWVTGTDTFYYLSEESGFSHLYVKSSSGNKTALTSGKYVVDNVTLSPDGKHLYYRANKEHPGIYNVYRVEIASGTNEQLTQWFGTLDYSLSPDGSALLLTATTATSPNELYVQAIGGEIKQLTDYTSNDFKQYPWQAPQVVAVPSNHGAGQIYARVYLPQGFDAKQADKYPAVVFNHGAGYLQNAHYGFSGYFREFMFHNLLTQQGYVVMDMDYRGSKGYGRDWRTAVYRNMGHPEVEDLKDGVAWLATNANVDNQRVGTYGGSYGGFLTFMALFNEPELFQAGAALRPVTDWAHYNAPYTANILNTPDIDPIAYERSSPIEHAQGLQKPLLIMTGVLDDNVFFQDSVRLVQRLIELEKPMFETAIYPVEPHGFVQPSSWLDEYRRIYKLFEQELK